jgi:hypothetical protein
VPAGVKDYGRATKSERLCRCRAVRKSTWWKIRDQDQNLEERPLKEGACVPHVPSSFPFGFEIEKKFSVLSTCHDVKFWEVHKLIPPQKTNALENQTRLGTLALPTRLIQLRH